MKNMAWDDEVWRKLKDAVSPMPVFVRKRALQAIIEASEQVARERGAPQVGEEDLVKAARERTPRLGRERMLSALAEHGLDVQAGGAAQQESRRRAKRSV